MTLLLKLLNVIIRLLFKVRVQGLEKIDYSQPLIIMPNHVSLLDALFLAVYLPPQVTFVVNTGISQRFSWVMKLRAHITVNPLNPYSVRKMIRVVKEGTPLVLFPEGRINTTSGTSLMKIYSGISYVALRTEAQVYPVIIQGLERSKLSYLGKKNKTVWFPQVSIGIYDPFVLRRQKDVLMRIQKAQATQKVYGTLQQAMFDSRYKKDVVLVNEVIQAAEEHGWDTVIVEDPSQSLSYRKLLVSSTVLSRQFQQVIANQKAPVGILLPSSVGHVITLFGLFRIGARPAILNFSQGVKTILDCCETAEIRTVFTSRTFIEKARLQDVVDALFNEGIQVVNIEDLKENVTAWDRVKGMMSYRQRVAPENHELILFTSGSESKPKGVVLTHDNLYANIKQVLCSIDITSQDKIMNVLPMFHSFGLTAGTLLPILSGVPTYLYPTPLHYKVIPELCYEKNATILFGTSTFLAGYGRFAHPYDFYSLRYVFAGAEKLKEEVRQLWLDKFGLRIIEGYGATETAPILSLNSPLAYKKGTVGRFVPGIEARIQPVEGIEHGGRLFVQGPNVMKGYLIYGKGFVPAESWYDTGDIVTMDEDGFIEIQARLKRFAKIGGEMVSLQRVEEVAGFAFGHQSVAAVSVPDPRKGERILVYTEQTTDGLEAVRAYIREQGLSPLMTPNQVHVVHRIPLLGSGKIDYVTLQGMAQSDGK